MIALLSKSLTQSWLESKELSARLRKGFGAPALRIAVVAQIPCIRINWSCFRSVGHRSECSAVGKGVMIELSISTIRSTPIIVYALALEDGCFYVGQSCKFIERVAAHFDGKGSAWTRRHRPVAVLCAKTVRTRDWKVAERFENRLTVFLMAKHGWQKVRGGFWSNICEKSTRGGLIHHGKTHVL